jgi:bacillithiol biosynthesis deacetylase BshB1
MGGAIVTLLAQGHEVTICDLTNGEPTPRGSPERRAEEASAAARILGVSRRITLPLPNRELVDTIENRRVVAEVIREVRPDLLFAPYWVDAHPDHVAGAALAEAARFYAKLTKTTIRGEPHFPRRVYHFLTTHYELYVRPSFILDVSESFERKLEAVGSYTSQFGTGPGERTITEWLRRTNGYWGFLIGKSYGEPFVCREELGLSSLGALL